MCGIRPYAGCGLAEGKMWNLRQRIDFGQAVMVMRQQHRIGKTQIGQGGRLVRAGDAVASVI
jgi:hypothetical protein